MRHLGMLVGSAGLMILGMMAVTWGFRDLPIDERPEWMVVETVAWPMVAMGILAAGRLNRLLQQGLRVRVDRRQLLVHGLPALLIAASPSGTFTGWVGGTSWVALLDFPTAKVMAAFWLAFTIWTAWEVVP
ncbi:MAG: hypothetical protein M0Z53_03165 [Thermaerobacter sp.]|nr:hypothetical protein [Thermaerobacter sp.]